MMMIGLLIMAVVMVIGFIMRRRAAAQLERGLQSSRPRRPHTGQGRQLRRQAPVLFRFRRRGVHNKQNYVRFTNGHFCLPSDLSYVIRRSNG